LISFFSNQRLGIACVKDCRRNLWQPASRPCGGQTSGVASIETKFPTNGIHSHDAKWISKPYRPCTGTEVFYILISVFIFEPQNNNQLAQGS
jgi:hypothetical protein